MNKNRVKFKFTYYFFITFTCILVSVSCDSGEMEDKYVLRDNDDKGLELRENDVSDSLKQYNYPSPILIDTGAFWNENESYEDRDYHVNAYSKVDTAIIEHYKSWSDSILNILGGGRRSMFFFFDDKENTPEIPVTMWFNDKNYEKHCFLLIQYKIDTVEYHWSPFEKKKAFR